MKAYTAAAIVRLDQTVPEAVFCCLFDCFFAHFIAKVIFGFAQFLASHSKNCC
jgi:hypothetical protein